MNDINFTYVKLESVRFRFSISYSGVFKLWLANMLNMALDIRQIQ